MGNLSARAQSRLDELQKAILHINEITDNNEIDDSLKTVWLLGEVAKQLAHVNYNLEIIDEDLENVENAVSGN